MAAEGDVRFGREMQNWEKRGGNFGLGLRMRMRLRKIEGQIEKFVVVKGILITFSKKNNVLNLVVTGNS